MSLKSSILGTVAVATLVANPLAAQEHGFVVSVRGGGYDALTDLNDAGTADLNKVGFNVGAGAAWEFNPYVAVRGDFTFARNQLRLDGADSGDELDRFFYDVAIQGQYPTRSGLTPYAFVGAGGVTLHPEDTDGQDHTKATGTAGLGLDYRIPDTGVSVFVEGRGWLYGTKDLEGAFAAYDKTQFELAWSGGFSYHFPR